jgi:hypothetical protein
MVAMRRFVVSALTVHAMMANTQAAAKGHLRRNDMDQ